MAQPLKIDFVSDVICPWCAVGLHSLLRALEEMSDEVSATIHFHPFELTPDMPRKGERVIPYLCAKYGMSEEQVAQNQAHITERGAELGFRFDFRADSRKWNTFDIHRLLYWAGEQGAKRQLAFKLALFDAYFSHNENPSDRALLRALAMRAGLSGTEAGEVYDSGRYGDEVRSEERRWQRQGVSAVPTLVFDERHVVSGGQPVEVFVQMIREALNEKGVVTIIH